MLTSPRRPSSIVVPDTVCIRIETVLAVPGMKLLGKAVKWTSAPVSQTYRSDGVSIAVERMFCGRRTSTVFAAYASVFSAEKPSPFSSLFGSLSRRRF